MGSEVEILATLFSSSATHIHEKQLVSAESCTWLDEHFQVSLAEARDSIDHLFLGGVNHVFYHGMAYSPRDAGWPRWLFYASTNFAPSNSFWCDLPELNGYIARCQSFLQAGRPDNDILLYHPIHELWHSDERKGLLLHRMSIHRSQD
jgi:alpha-L-rhamnosidase